MLDNSNAFASFSVDNIEEARKFYHDTLGLEVNVNFMPENKKILGLKFSNGTECMLYAKPDHKPATFTVLNFQVDDVKKAVAELHEKGVEFLHYIGNDNNEIAHPDGMDIAWFKDPAGNFLSIVKTPEQ